MAIRYGSTRRPVEALGPKRPPWRFLILVSAASLVGSAAAQGVFLIMGVV